MPRSQGDITAAALLGTWTDSDTAMQIVGTSLGIFGPGLLDPERALSNETPLRNALFDVLLSLVEGGAIDMRPTDDGLYAFRWRPDYAVAGLISETASSIDIDPPSPYLAELVRTRHERDEALGRAQFAEALAEERERLLRSASAPAAPAAPKRAASRRAAPKLPDEIDLRDPAPIANETDATDAALDAPAAKPAVRKPAARKATKPKAVAATKAQASAEAATETAEVEPAPEIAVAAKPAAKRAKAKTSASASTPVPAAEPASEQAFAASVDPIPEPEVAPNVAATAVESTVENTVEETVEEPAEETVEQTAEETPNESVVEPAAAVDDEAKTEPVADAVPAAADPAPKAIKAKTAKVRGKRKGLTKRGAKADLEVAASAGEPETNDVVYLTQPEPVVDIDLTGDDEDAEPAEDESAPRRAKWSGYTLDKPRAHLSSVDRLADEG